MNRHLPYLCASAKLPVMLAGLAWFVWSGASAELVASVEGLAGRSALLPVPAYWLIMVMGLLILVFPLNLMEEHFLRAQEGGAEEGPARNWVIGFFWELAILSVIGIAITLAMRTLGDHWWMAMVGLWLAYTIAAALLQKFMLRSNDDEEASLAQEPIGKELSTALAPYGIKTGKMQLIDEEENPHLTPDIYFIKQQGKLDLLIPLEWANKWSVPELVAACLHKSWMSRPVMRETEMLMNLGSGALILGGYHAAFPALSGIIGQAAVADLSAMPWLIAWIACGATVLRIAGFTIFRQWILQADAAVAKQMQSPDGMLSALNRARADSGEPPPRWAEIIFFSTPSLDRRIAKLDKPG